MKRDEKFKQITKQNAKDYIRDKEKRGYWADAVLPRLLLVIIDELERIGKRKTKRKIKLSAYNIFFGKGIKSGLTAKQIAKNWKELKIKKEKKDG